MRAAELFAFHQTTTTHSAAITAITATAAQATTTATATATATASEGGRRRNVFWDGVVRTRALLLCAPRAPAPPGPRPRPRTTPAAATEGRGGWDIGREIVRGDRAGPLAHHGGWRTAAEGRGRGHVGRKAVATGSRRGRVALRVLWRPLLATVLLRLLLLTLVAVGLLTLVLVTWGGRFGSGGAERVGW